MAAPALGVRRRFVPSSASVDWSHPLAQGLEFCGIPSISLDIAKGRVATNVVSAPQVYGERPSDFGLATVARWENNATTDLGFTSGPFSIAVINTVFDNTGYFTSFGRSAYVSESNNQGWELSSRPTADTRRGLSFVSNRNNNVTSYALSTLVVASPGTYVHVGRSNGSNLRELFINGLRLNSTASNINPLSSTGPLFLGTSNNATVIALAWNRSINNNEIAMLTSSPFCLLRY